MTHRTEAVILWLDETEEEWDKKISESRHSRYPVCDGSADNVIGVLHVKEYYTIEDKSRENIMKKVTAIPIKDVMPLFPATAIDNIRKIRNKDSNCPRLT